MKNYLSIILLFLIAPLFICCSDDDELPSPMDGNFKDMNLLQIKGSLQGTWQLSEKRFYDTNEICDEREPSEYYQQYKTFSGDQYRPDLICAYCTVVASYWEIPKWEKKDTFLGGEYYCFNTKQNGEFIPIKLEKGELTIITNNTEERNLILTYIKSDKDLSYLWGLY